MLDDTVLYANTGKLIWCSNADGHTLIYKKAQLSLTNPRDACEKFARFT